MAKTWTPEERKAFGDKMKSIREAKTQTPPTEQSPIAEEIAPVSEVQDDPVAAKLAELDAAIKKTHELNAKLEEQSKEQSKVFDAGIAKMSVQEQTHVLQAHKSKADKMKENLAGQPRVRVYVPLEGKERMGTLLPVTLNGYRVNVPKGVYVDVPEQVGTIIMDSLNQTQEAINSPFLIDGDAKKENALLG